MFGVRFFLVTRILRGGEGHWRLRRVLVGDWMYDGFIREGSSSMGLTMRQVGLEEKERQCKGCARCRHGRMRRCKSLMVEAERYRVVSDAAKGMLQANG